MKILPTATVQACALLFTLVSASQLCAEEIIAKAYDIKNVHEVVVHGGGRLELVQGDSESLRVEAEKEIMDRVVVDQSGGKLTLSVRNLGNGFNFFHWFDRDDYHARNFLQLRNLKYQGISCASHATCGDWNDK